MLLITNLFKKGGIMKIFLPCKLGEIFTERKFVDWSDGKRVYKDGKTMILKGFDKGLHLPSIYACQSGSNIEFLSYGICVNSGLYEDFIPKYKICIDDSLLENRVLQSLGFPSNRIGRFYSVFMEGKLLTVDFCLEPRAEHIRYPIKPFNYAELNENDVNISLEYDKDANERRNTENNNCKVFHKTNMLKLLKHAQGIKINDLREEAL